VQTIGRAGKDELLAEFNIVFCSPIFCIVDGLFSLNAFYRAANGAGKAGKAEKTYVYVTKIRLETLENIYTFTVKGVEFYFHIRLKILIAMTLC